MEAAPENPEMGDPIPGSTSRQHLPGSSCWDAWGVGCGVHTLGNICCSKAQGWLCGTAPAPCPRSSRTLQISQGSPAPPLHPCSILSSIYAPSSRPRCPGMALCLASQLQ